MLETDLAGVAAGHRWPAFAAAGAERGVRGTFAFPVGAGAAKVGVLSVYRREAGPLRSDQLADALVFADAVFVLTLDHRHGLSADLDEVIEVAFTARRAEVHQAAGRIAAQQSISVTDAFARLRAHAYSSGLSLHRIATDVMADRLRLESDLNGSAGRNSLRNGQRTSPPEGTSDPNEIGPEHAETEEEEELMSASDRRVREVFIELSDTLVDDFDIIEFLDRLAARCSELLGVSACGILLADHHGVLNLVAASSEQARLVELTQLQNLEGPCLEAFTTGHPVQNADLRDARTRWPRFTAAAVGAGYLSVQAMPMRLRDSVLGAVNLFSKSTGSLDADTITLGQALADAATIGIVHQRALARQEIVTEQLQTALNSRILIEQAKGFLTHSLSIGVDEAFAVLRAYARANNRRLTDVADDVVQGRLTMPATPVRPALVDTGDSRRRGTSGALPVCWLR